MSVHRAEILSLACGLVMLFSLSSVHARDYIVENGNQVDSQTFRGYTLYRNWCARCHGTFAQGLSAPSLTSAQADLSYSDYMDIVANGQQGRNGVMPAWRGNSVVMDGREAIYRYLKARSDGALPAEKPQQR